MATNNYTLAPQPPTTFTYLGQSAAGGAVIGGVLIGDYVNNTTTTPPGSSYNVPTSTLVATVPVSAILELQSTTGTLLIPRMTTTQRNALITVTNGMMIYNSTTTTFQFYQNGGWVSLSAGAGGVVGPGGGSTDNAVARWDGAGGNTLQDSVVIVSDTGAVTGVLTIAADAGTAAAPSYAFTGDVDTGMYHSAANTVDFATNGLRQVSIGTVATTVNYLQFIGSAAGATVKINSLGTDTDVGIELAPKGAGQVVIPVGVLATPGVAFTGDLDTGMWHSAANTLDFSTNAFRALQLVASPALSVNYATVTASATGNAVLVSAAGSDTNIGIGLIPKGTGGVEGPVGAVATPGYTFTTDTDTGMWHSAANTIDFSTGALRQFQVANSATVVNWISVTGAATAGAGAGPGQPKFVANGTDTLVDVAVQSKGAASGLSLLPNTAAGAGLLKLWNGGGTFYASIQGGNIGSNVTWTWPILDATVAGAPLVSSSAGVLSFANDGMLSKSSTLTSANIQAMYAVPVEILPAAPANTMYVIHRFMWETVFVVAQANGGNVGLQYGTTQHLGGTAATATFANTVVNAAESTAITVAGALAATARTSLVATSVTISNDGAAFDTGTSTAKYTVWYSIVSI